MLRKTNNFHNIKCLAYRRIIMLQKIGNCFHFQVWFQFDFPKLTFLWLFPFSLRGSCHCITYITCNLKCCFCDFHNGFLMKIGTNECVGIMSCECLCIFFFYLFIKCLWAICGIKAFIQALWALQNYRKSL